MLEIRAKSHYSKGIAELTQAQQYRMALAPQVPLSCAKVLCTLRYLRDKVHMGVQHAWYIDSIHMGKGTR